MEISLRLKVKGVEIELSKDEAIKLREALEELTGKVVKQVEWVPYNPYPWRWWTWPYGNYTTTTTWKAGDPPMTITMEAPISDSVCIYATMSN